MKIKEKIDQYLGYFLVLIIGLMVINVLWQVFTRFVMGKPSSFTEELARYLMIWVGLLGAAYVSGKKKHVAIDLLKAKLNEAKKRTLQIVVNSIITLFAIFVLVVGGFRLVYITYVLEQYSPALQLPLAIVYLVLPLSGILISFYKILDLIQK